MARPALIPAAVAIWWGWGVRLGRAERALRTRDAWHSGILAACPDAVVAVDPAGRVLEFNTAAEKLFACPRAGAVGQPAADLVGPALARHLTGTSAAGKRLHVAARRPDGTEFPVELTVSRAVTPAGLVVTGFVRDRTDRDRAERALRESEARYRELVDQAVEPIFVLGPEGKIARPEPPGVRQPRVRPGRAGRPGPEPPGGQRVADRPVVHSTQTVDTIYRRKDGTTFPVEVRFGSFAVAGERLTLALVRDISQRRRAEAALRQSEALFRLVWDSAADGMRLTDADGIVVRANPAYCRLVGRPAERGGRPAVGRRVRRRPPGRDPAQAPGAVPDRGRPPPPRVRGRAVGRPAAVVRGRRRLPGRPERADPAARR